MIISIALDNFIVAIILLILWRGIGVSLLIEIIKHIEEEKRLRKGYPEPELRVTFLEKKHQ